MNLFHLSLALLMLITGSINTLSVKWADTMKSESTDGHQRKFQHPFLQACGMFLGEMMCMVAFFIVRWNRKRKREPDAPDDEFTRPRNFNPFVFYPPALCDMTATSIQYIGLTLTYASSFQMLRGAVIIFTGLFSRIFLRRHLQWFRWLGILFVIAGLVVVGLSDIAHEKGGDGPKPNKTLSEDLSFHEYYGGKLIGSVKHLYGDSGSNGTSQEALGDILIVCAQVIVATQMVYEEKFVSKYNVPALQAVGWEGTFGFFTLATLLVPFYFIPVGRFGNNPRHVLEDAYDGLYQLAHNPQLALAFCGTVVSIAFFNFAGISVTKEMSATTRMVLDSIRTLVIWTVSLGVGWQAFQWLQLLGFVILVVGMCLYNDLFFMPLFRKIAYRFGWITPPYEDLHDDESETGSEEPEATVFDTQGTRQSDA